MNERKRLLFDIDPELHRRFKIACAAGNVPMGTVCNGLVEKWLNDKGADKTPTLKRSGMKAKANA